MSPKKQKKLADPVEADTNVSSTPNKEHAQLVTHASVDILRIASFKRAVHVPMATAPPLLTSVNLLCLAEIGKAVILKFSEVDESQSDHFKPLPLPLPKFYNHFTMSFPEDNHIDDADAKEFLFGYIHHQDDNELELSGVKSDGEDHENEDEESSDDGLLAMVQQQLPSTKLQAKRVPAQKTQHTKSSGKGNKCSSEAMLPTSSDDHNHPKTCIFKIQFCIQHSQGSKSDEELDIFKDCLQPLIVPQYLPSGHLSTQLLKPIHVIFEDSGNDSVVERPAHTSTTNSHKAMQKTATVNEKLLALLPLTKRSKSNDELEAAGHTMQPMPAAMPMPAPYAYAPPPVIIVPPATPWGMQQGYPGYPPMPLGSLLPPHMSTGHMSHPAMPSLLTVDLPNEDLPQAPEMVSFPDIILETLQAWLGVEVETALVIRSYMDMDIQAVKVGKHVLPIDN
ncbi:hypothetical protein EDC04DRAFT_2972422 [Pisolithus marmoratus]|nr:hypothetical protein EDC04DRAFT_2972422 [Pisolithus marmoratus]